jgi:hypothetical protein
MLKYSESNSETHFIIYTNAVRHNISVSKTRSRQSQRFGELYVPFTRSGNTASLSCGRLERGEKLENKAVRSHLPKTCISCTLVAKAVPKQPVRIPQSRCIVYKSSFLEHFTWDPCFCPLSYYMLYRTPTPWAMSGLSRERRGKRKTCL